jgi:DNA-binding transcriptional MerR regulator
MTHRRAPAAASQPEPPGESERGAYLQIGEVAERTGVTQRTLRFYEEKGLLKPPSRLEGGFRLYSEDDVQRVEAIKRLQTLLGFSLADIKEMVEAEEVKLQIKATYRRDAETSDRIGKLRKAVEVTERQVEVIDQKLQALEDMRAHLRGKLDQYATWLATLEEQAAALTSASAGD